MGCAQSTSALDPSFEVDAAKKAQTNETFATTEPTDESMVVDVASKLAEAAGEARAEETSVMKLTVEELTTSDVEVVEKEELRMEELSAEPVTNEDNDTDERQNAQGD
ncbi:unnamed protein product [Hyaloperonospora brassicae]|uniref:RxLR effector candidate protein n=1 Tax=Hyaloperonospora brassicae TaxID=162125 RepID=A0AAV0TUZ9_HYABA|nr:unnamed protein product [Hyaloperonospora brassicae]